MWSLTIYSVCGGHTLLASVYLFICFLLICVLIDVQTKRSHIKTWGGLWNSREPASDQQESLTGDTKLSPWVKEYLSPAWGEERNGFCVTSPKADYGTHGDGSSTSSSPLLPAAQESDLPPEDWRVHILCLCCTRNFPFGYSFSF